MATTVTSTRPKKVRERGIGGGPKFPGPNGKGPRGNGHGRPEDSRRGFPPAAYSITAWIILASIIMMFAALSSAYIILSSGSEFRPVRVPRMFFFSTAIILLSSFSFETAKRSLKQGKTARYLRLLALTLVLGLLFLAAQVMGWRELASQGVFFASHPHSSFFYLFTGVHGVHLFGGMLALTYLLVKGHRASQRSGEETTQTATAVVSRYWHTMDGLWIWLLLLLLIWR